MRLKMSRPSSSVPSQYDAEGALRIVVKLVWNGSWLAISGASTASTTNSSTIPRPSMAIRLRLNFAQARLRLRGGVTAAAVAGSALMNASGGD
ncbi:hypothetical protein D9M69_655270 [compost metagenome]